jgi:two-component sensor histidine kinase/Tfp pilus assembly protein PilF
MKLSSRVDLLMLLLIVSVSLFGGTADSTAFYTSLLQKSFEYPIERALASIDSVKVFAASRQDAEMMTLVLLAQVFQYSQMGNLEEAKGFMSDAQTMVDSLAIPRLTADAVYMQARLNTSLTRYAEGYRTALQALDLYEELAIDSSLANVHSLLGDIYRAIKKYDSALEEYQMALQLAGDQKRHPLFVRDLQSIGRCYQHKGEFDRAIDFFRQARDISHPGEKSYVWSYIWMAQVYMDKRQPARALEYDLQALELAKINGDEHLLGIIYNEIAFNYQLMNNYEKALEYNFLALKTRQKAKRYALAESSQRNIGNLYLELGKLDLAEQFLQQSLVTSQDLDYQFVLPDVYRILSSVYEKRGNYSQALSYFKRYQAKKDSILNQQIFSSIADMRISFDISKTTRETKALKQKAQIQELELKRSQAMRNMTLVIAVLMVVVVILMYGRIVARKKTAEVLEEKVHNRTIQLEQHILERRKTEELLQKSLNEKNILLQEVHHRVKNNMQIISSMLNLQVKQVHDAAMQEMFKDTQNRVKTMALIHEKLYQAEDLAHINLKNYLRTLCHQLFRSYRTDPARIFLNLDIIDGNLDVKTAIPCGLIINEAVSNSLKYAFPADASGTIGVRFQREQDVYVLNVWDDGVGLEAPVDVEQTESLGVRLIDALTQQLHGSLEITSTGGVSIGIRFPVTL